MAPLSLRHPFRGLLAGRGKEPGLEDIRRASQNLDPLKLTGLEDSALTPPDFRPDQAPARLFGYYTARGVEYALREMGLFRQLEALGYSGFKVILSGDPFEQDMTVHARAQGQTHLLMQGRFKKKTWTAPAGVPLKKVCGDEIYSAVDVEWVMLQNPLARFTPERPRLPGQKHPGLGLRDEVMAVFHAAARRLSLDLYLITPKMFHNAVIYSPMCFFPDPARQAQLLALQEAGRGRSLLDQTLAVEGGFVERRDPGGAGLPGGVLHWIASPMIRPLSQRLLAACHDSGYRPEVERLAREIEFCIDWLGLAARRDALLELFRDAPPEGEAWL